MTSPVRNRLASTTSPYLQQHANNPVDWYPWGEEALQRAREEDKPILLSIGYSACHWCHVMAHESFEDPETAALMNELFINIKVDREERPDLDKIYQLAHQILTQRPGGWPLTMFLTPDGHIPYFGGTYFPKQPRYNMPAFGQILKLASDYYHREKTGMAQHNAALTEALATISAPAAEIATGAHLLERARQELAASFDSEYGGFGQAPKFPHCSNLEFLLRYWHGKDGDDDEALRMVTTTLRKMAEGGIYDQLGGGFCRYSVDDFWLIPHFEKMLYDNGPLLALSAQLWQISGDPLFRQVTEETAGWVMAEMQDPEGGYYSSLDADSEGEEGAFYVWSREQVRDLLSAAEYAVTAAHYGLNRPDNFEGKWHLHVARPLSEVASEVGIDLKEATKLLTSARAKLRAAREQRIRPGRDDKILSSWNALMIKGMAIAGRVLQRPDWIASGRRAFDFIRTRLWQDGRLLATCKDGRAHLNAYLDDYAYLIDAGLELLQSDWRDDDLHWIQTLAEVLLEQFEDPSHGGFFFTANDHEALIHRPKPMMDESIPAGNGIAAQALLRLGHLLGEPRYIDAGLRTLSACSAAMDRFPHAHGSLLMALAECDRPVRTVLIQGPERQSWQAAAQSHYHPNLMCFAPENVTPPLPPFPPAAAGNTRAQLCSGTACQAPAETLEVLLEQLNQSET